jgi:hypothetical protein
MADPPRSPQSDDDARPIPNRAGANNRSRWGVVLGIIFAIALVALVVFLHITGTIGPGTH